MRELHLYEVEAVSAGLLGAIIGALIINYGINKALNGKVVVLNNQQEVSDFSKFLLSLTNPR